ATVVLVATLCLYPRVALPLCLHSFPTRRSSDLTVSGLRLHTKRPDSDSLSLRLHVFHLTLHTIVTRRSILQEVRRHAQMALRLLVGTRFQVLFHSPSGVLFTFPSWYWFTIGHQGVFSLGRWSSRIPTEFLVFRRTQDPLRRKRLFDYRALTFCGRPFQAGSSKTFLGNSNGVSYNPGKLAFRFGLLPFRSPLLGKSHLLSVPPGTEMF